MFSQGQNTTFRPAANRAANMTNRCSTTTAGQYKRMQWRQQIIQTIYLPFNSFYFFGVNNTGTLQFCLFKIGSQIGTYCEKTVLNMTDKYLIRFIRQVSDKHSQISIQLVHCTVCFQTDMGFRYPCTTY